MSNFVWQEAAACKPSRFGLHLGSILFTFVLLAFLPFQGGGVFSYGCKNH